MSDEFVINNIPALTWNWLRINNTKVTSSENFVDSENQTISNIPEGVEYICDAINVNKDILNEYKNIENAIGNSIDEKFFSANKVSCISSNKNVNSPFPIVINFSLQDKTNTSSYNIIHAKENSSITVIMVYESESNYTGTQAIRTICHAEKNAVIHLVKVQLLGKEFVQIDDTANITDESGRVEMTQVILGGKETYIGVAATLKNYKSSFDSASAYLCRENQKLDMNYIVRHIGKKTDCNMIVKGTMYDNSQKTYRGTIDFKNGCVGATGNEQEETLLLSPTVINKSIPLILCDEEDVAGEHGATIGKLSKDVLFYMEARGISQKKAEELITKAKVHNVASRIPDTNTIEKINNFLDEVFVNE